MFAFHFPGVDTIKVYRPFNKKYKWLSNTTSSDIYGLEQLSNQRELVYLTSSLKDVMTLYSIGYEAVALQSETNSLNKELKQKLSSYKKVIIFYDNDRAGKEATKQLLKELPNSEFIFTPIEDFKDPSDFVKAYSLEELKEFLDETGSFSRENISKFL